MRNAERLLDVAFGVAIHRKEHNSKFQEYTLASAAMRSDGKIVTGYNQTYLDRHWQSHAESRVCRKLDVGSVVAVVRIGEGNGWRMAKPCASCVRCMKRTGVERVLYSIRENEYGTMVL